MDNYFKKGNTKNSITIRRADGSSTWMEAEYFMIVHDMAHFVVEKKLQIKNGFYGLVAIGIDITDFEKKQKITPEHLPKEAIKTEVLVGLILTELNDRKRLEDFNATFNSTAAQYDLSKEEFNADDLNGIHDELNQLLGRWTTLSVNDSINMKW